MEAVKPLHRIDDEGESFHEWPEDIVSYTLDDLKEISELLSGNYTELYNYLKENALIGSPKM
jgi:hypothetical protein